MFNLFRFIFLTSTTTQAFTLLRQNSSHMYADKTYINHMSPWLPWWRDIIPSIQPILGRNRVHVLCAKLAGPETLASSLYFLRVISPPIGAPSAEMCWHAWH